MGGCVERGGLGWGWLPIFYNIIYSHLIGFIFVLGKSSDSHSIVVLLL